MQRAVNILFRFCRERLFAALISQVIIEPLHVNGGQLREPQRADGGLDVLLDVCLVTFDCARLYAV